MSQNENSGHRERLREKYLSEGINGFHYDYEKLEFLLTFCIPRRDVKPHAKNLIAKFSNLEGVLKASSKELEDSKIINRPSIAFLKFIADLNKDLFLKSSKKDITTLGSKNEVIGYLKNEIGYEARENFVVLYLDSANHLIQTKNLFQGTIDRSAIYPREILEGCFECKAKSVIFAHNHPSGNLEPSRADIELTNNLKTTLASIDVRLLDHVVITRESYFSFLEEDLL
ncbi:MAG: RadC family protein [Fusobacteriaceae bacterium]